jgi:AraC-like DNA-binding protein
LFIAGSFNRWSPGDENYRLRKDKDGIYSIVLPDSLSSFEYKFTQGAWAFAEGTQDGKSIPNRVFNRDEEENPNQITVQIMGWEALPSYNFIVIEVPPSTPPDAALFIMGNFNEWKPADESFRLRRQVDGTYHISISTPLDKLEYKFTRGSEHSVEGKAGGGWTYNRVLLRTVARQNLDFQVRIDGWEDLSGGFQLYSFYNLLLLFAVFQGILLLITIPTIQGYNRSANSWLLLLIGLSSVLLFVKVLGNFSLIAHNFTKLLLWPDFIIFVYAPLFYLYVHKLLFNEGAPVIKSYHFMPLAVHLGIYSFYFTTDSRAFSHLFFSPGSTLQVIRFIIGCIGLVFSAFFIWRSLTLIKNYEHNYRANLSYGQNLQYLKAVLFIQIACLIVWLLAILITALSKAFGGDMVGLISLSFETVWMAFSLITFFLGYFAIHEPDIFRLPPIKEPTNQLKTAKAESIPAPGAEAENALNESIDSLKLAEEKQLIVGYMERYKPYTNPKLTLVDLAHKLKIPPHALSRIINVGFGKNFFDFINSYRIEEFKRRVEDIQYKNHTLLSIAFDVGFNSKTAFNRSFKKITNQTPSNYYQNVKEF